MHDHNLDDLIIENIEPKHSKTKSLLTIIALLIVVLIVAIIFTKTLLKEPDNSDLAFEQDMSEMIAPELKLKEPDIIPEPEKESSLSTVIERKPAVETEKTAPALKLPTAHQRVDTKKEPALSNLTQNEVKAPTVKNKEAAVNKKDAADIAYWESVQAQRKAEKAAREHKAKEAANQAVPATKRTQAKKAPVPATKKRVVAKPSPKQASTTRYYIQVGAFKKQPSKRFLSVIKNNRLTYHITKPNAYNMKQLLIGPYKDKVSAQRALTRVRDRIMKRAFIVVKR
jgi:DedD protein